MLFNGAKTLMGKVWSGEERCTERPETPACCQVLLRGQTLIGHDGRLTRTNAAQGEPELMTEAQVYLGGKNTLTHPEMATH